MSRDSVSRLNGWACAAHPIVVMLVDERSAVSAYRSISDARALAKQILAVCDEADRALLVQEAPLFAVVGG